MKEGKSEPHNFRDFQETLDWSSPPSEWPEALRSIWWDACEDWHNAHEIAQDISGSIGNWIHAYLHRKEGDKYNAGYWYNRANRNFPTYSLAEEQKVIVDHLLAKYIL